MFEGLKNKLKGFVSIFSKKVEEEPPVEEKPATPKKEQPVKKEPPERKPAKEEPPVKEEPTKVSKTPEEEPIQEEPVKLPIRKETQEPAKDKHHKISEPAKKDTEEPEHKRKIPEQHIDVPVKHPEHLKPLKPVLIHKAAEKLQVQPEPEAESPLAATPDIPVPQPEVKKGFLDSIKERFTAKAPEERKGFADIIAEKLTKTVIRKDKFAELFEELEIMLLENNVAVEVIDKIKADLAKDLVDVPLPRGKVEDTIRNSLSASIESLFDVKGIDLLAAAKSKKPFVILLIGINGSGKTTTIAKLAHLFQSNGLRVVMAAGDTFRAAAIQQLEQHANNLNIKIIKHDYGADSAAVAFDAIKYAEAKGIDVVLIDTAGRLHSNVNLMDELKKISRVAKPDFKLFIGESITGNDCVEQARKFNEDIGIDGIILSKADVDDKGGAAISVSFVTGKPILFMGTGQGYDDLKPFDPQAIMQALGLAG